MSKHFWIKQMSRIINYFDNSKVYDEIITNQYIGATAYKYWYEEADNMYQSLFFINYQTDDQYKDIYKKCLMIQNEFNKIRKELEKYESNN